MPAHSVELPLPGLAAEKDRTCADAIADELPPQLVRMAAGAARGMGLARLGNDCLQRIVSGPDLLMSSAKVWLKNDAGRRVALIEADAGSADSLWCCKEAVSRRWWVRFIAPIVSVRAWNAFYQGLILRRLHISTPQPLAVVTVTRHGSYHEYLLTDAVPGAASLQVWLGRHKSHETAGNVRPQRCKVAQQLGLLLQRLHAERFDHRDLKPTNLLLSDAGRVWLIDLDSIWRWPVLPRSRRVQNLARLWAGLARHRQVTATEALRFLLAYLTPKQRGDWKSLWRQVVRRAAGKIEQKT